MSTLLNFFDDLKKNENDIIINVHEYKTLTDISISIFENINPTTRLIFDFGVEGQVAPWIQEIYELLNYIKIDASNVFFITGAVEGVKIHNDYCNKNNITNRIHVYVCNFWEWYTHLHFVEQHDVNVNFITYSQGPKEKLYLCFNRICRPHRLALLGLLSNADTVKNSYYSLSLTSYSSTNINNQTYIQENKNLKKYLDMVSYHVSNSDIINSIVKGMHKIELPLRLNSPPEINTNTIIASDEVLYRNSFFSLVTETHFFPFSKEGLPTGHEIFFTEKTYKPIAMKHPFILLSPAKTLYNLRKLGYQTFAPYIDETYDTIADNESRLLAVVSEVERLSKQSPEEWAIWEAAVAPIVEHNYNILKNKTNMSDYVLEKS